MPTAYLRDRWVREIAGSSVPTPLPTIWTWADLRFETFARGEPGPGWISPAGLRCAIALAVDRVIDAGGFRDDPDLARTAGNRRRLADQFRAWTHQGRPPGGRRPDGADADTWMAYGHLRSILERTGCDDEAGITARLERHLGGKRRWIWEAFPRIAVVDPTRLGPLDRGLFRVVVEQAHELCVWLPGALPPDRGEVSADLIAIRESLLESGFEETTIGEDREVEPPRPGALRHAVDRLFGPAHVSADVAGLLRWGLPQVEGEALGVARAVRDALASGIQPGEIVVAVPRRGSLVDRIAETLRTWGIACHARRSRRLASDPRVAALLLAQRVVVEGWEAASLAQLLSHGSVQLETDRAEAREWQLAAADEVRRSRVIRGLDPLRAAIGRPIGQEGSSRESEPRRRARETRRSLALRILDRFASILSPLRVEGTWLQHCERIQHVARDLGITNPTSDGLAELFSALDQQADVLVAAGMAGETWRFERFAGELMRMAAELELDEPAPPHEVVEVRLAEELEGVCVDVVVLAGLEEGSFPDGDKLNHTPPPSTATSQLDWIDRAALAREMRSFLGVVVAPRRSLVLICPTSTADGQRLLPSGFLDAMERLFTAEAWASISASWSRLGAVLPSAFAGSLAERRMLAISRAALDEDASDLGMLATDPAHRHALAGVAVALRVNHLRDGRGRVGALDGQIHDQSIVGMIGKRIESGPRPLSISELETFAFCPFQYFQRHILGLEPRSERDEFAEDPARQGGLVHEALETLHRRLAAEPTPSGLAQAMRQELGEQMIALLEPLSATASDVDRGRRALEAERLRRVANRYADQLLIYEEKHPTAVPSSFELSFGRPGDEHPPFELVLGDERPALKLSGVIDRIDLVDEGGARRFRVIDYKTGAGPARADFNLGLALQLPLYLLAAHHLVLGPGVPPLDASYWSISRGGFVPLVNLSRQGDNAIEDLSSLVRRYLAELVDRMAKGWFPVLPRRYPCESRCEYALACRVRQMRSGGVAKRLSPLPPLIGRPAP